MYRGISLYKYTQTLYNCWRSTIHHAYLQVVLNQKWWNELKNCRQYILYGNDFQNESSCHKCKNIYHILSDSSMCNIIIKNIFFFKYCFDQCPIQYKKIFNYKNSDGMNNKTIICSIIFYSKISKFIFSKKNTIKVSWKWKIYLYLNVVKTYVLRWGHLPR